MTIIQLPDTYNFSGTIRDIVVDATEKLDFTLSSNGVTIVSETYYPSSDNRITINLRDILEDIIEPVLYDVAETVIPQYTYQIGETTGSFYCIAGGIDAEVSVESYLQGNFLTWQPQTRVTLYHIPHYLRYVSVVESICKVKAFFPDGTSEVAVLKTFSAKSINTVNVTFGTVRGMFESQPTYFDVWVENLEGEMLTWIQRYMLTDFLTGVNDYFIFANSLGGFDTIRFSGDREETNKLDSVNAVFDDETKEYDIDRTRSWKKYTGYITDERIRMWVLDFFNSSCRYHLTDSGVLKRIYISDHKLESTIGDSVGYEFTYVYSVQSRYINIERTSTPPVLEITDPQSEIFFLAPKLNQFELAKIESETDYLFPVQSPMAGKWLAISLKTILDFVSSKGLDVDALQIYLTDHKYATQDWVKEQNYLTSANMDDYVLKKTWDSVFELAEVNGKQVLKIKYDVIGNLGITAYGTGLDSGESFTGSLVDLVDVAVSGLKAGDILKYNGTHFVNVPISSIAGASSWEQISGKPEYFPTRWSEIKDAPESLPASDVYPWAKAATKPSYNWDEITDKPSVFTPASHTHVWANITDRPTKLSQFQDDVVDGNYFKLSAVRTTDLNDAPINSFFVSSNNPANSPASYTTYAVGLTLALNNDKNFKQQLIYTADNWYYRSQGGGDWWQWHVLWSAANFNPSNKLDKSVWDEAFEIKTVNGVRVISAKLDVLGQKGISAYADSADSGSAGGSLDYELLKNALTGIITPDGYPFTISSKFLGAIDKSYITGQIGDLYADSVHTHKWSDITDRPTSLPANGGNADSAIKLNNSQEFDFSTSALSYLNLYGPAGSGVLVNDCPTNDWWHILRCLRADVNGYYTDIAVPMGGNALYWKRVWNGTLQNNGWVKIWDSVNLTKLSQLQDDVVDGNYFKLSANRVTNLNDTPINSFFTSSQGPANSPASSAFYVNGFCFAADNNSIFKKQLVYADDWYGRTQVNGTWGGWYKFWHSGNLNPVTIDSDQIITGWKRFNPSTKNGVFNTTGIIGNKDTYGTPFSWNVKSSGSFWNVQQESDSITLIGIQGGKAIKLLSNHSQSQVIADFFVGIATKARQDESGNSIADSYLRLTGGTLTGSLTTQNITANGTVTADRFSGPLNAKYTGNGGQQGPGYIGTNSFGCLMMNTTINGDSSYKDWLICDAYDWADAGGAIAIGVSRQNMNVFAMSSDADRKTWTRKCQLYTTENANRNSVDWTARNITASGSVTAPTFVGKLSGASSLLNINNDAGQRSVLQFMQMSTQNEANDLPSNTWHHVLKMNHGNGDTYFSRSLAFSFFDNGIYTRYRSNGTAHEWVALYGGHNANRSDVDWTARNINASETGTFKKLVINGIVIDVVNGNVRINGNLVATGGVTSQATA